MFIQNICEFVQRKLDAGLRPELYIKNKPIRARPGKIGEIIITKMANGHIETTRTIKSADEFIITNPDCEEYVIDRAQLTERYQKSDTDGLYYPKNLPQEIIFTPIDIEFIASWGEQMNIKSGGALNITNRANGYVYGIQADEFTNTYTKYTSPLFEQIEILVAN
ncbi:MAG: hypothetical protein LBU68_02830, partial [Rickettsiales bacterium]|nr:hypothetical protein [Rickettsiales bacterium]